MLRTTCFKRLATLLKYVATWCMVLDQIWFLATILDVAWCCTRLAAFVQHLRPGQTYATFQRNTTCWTCLTTLLQYVAACWMVLDQIWKCSNVAWCCTRLATFMQHCCTGACALVYSSICYFKEPSNMLQHIATGRPNVCNMLCI